jgi:hypothetical protein
MLWLGWGRLTIFLEITKAKLKVEGIVFFFYVFNPGRVHFRFPISSRIKGAKLEASCRLVLSVASM